MKRLLLCLALLFLLAACTAAAPSEADIQTAIAQTVEARPAATVTPRPTATTKRIKLPTATPAPPTSTPVPTNTPAPTPTNTPTSGPIFAARVSCADLYPEFIEELDSLVQTWDDANQLAGNTARIALSEPVAQLQEIRRDALNLDPPTQECGEDARYYLLRYMDTMIDSYLEFMADADMDREPAISSSNDLAQDYKTAYDSLFDTVQEDTRNE